MNLYTRPPHLHAQIKEDSPIYIEADKVEYTDVQNKVTYSGHVEIKYKDKIITADEIIFWNKTKTLQANGHVIYTQKNGTIFYSDSITIKNDWSDSILNHIYLTSQSQSFHLTADKAFTKGNITSFHNIAYTSCRPCQHNPNKKPLWRLTSKTSQYNQSKNIIKYQHVYFEVLNNPIFYLPYLSHVADIDRNHNKQTGFLFPSLHHNSERGLEIELPYFINLAPHYDLTLQPRITEKLGTLITTHWRHLLEKGKYDIRLHGIWTPPKNNPDNNKSFRGGLFANAHFNITPKWNLNIQIEENTDELFLRRYDISTQNHLTTSASLQHMSEMRFMNLNATRYTTALSSITDDSSPTILPHLYTSSFYEMPHATGYIQIDTDFILLSGHNKNTTRFVLDGKWNKQFIFPTGHKIQLLAGITEKIYNAPYILNSSNHLDDSLHQQTRAYIGGEWSMPFIHYTQESYQMITPMIQIISASHFNNNNDIYSIHDRYINTDLDRTTLFTPHHSTGYDFDEKGTRIDYGLSYTAQLKNNTKYDFFIGQSQKTEKSPNFTTNRNAQKRPSDYIIHSKMITEQRYNIENKLRISTKNGNLLHSESRIVTQSNNTYLSISHIYLNAHITNDNHTRKEIQGKLSYHITDNWKIDVENHYDINRNIHLKNTFSLTYKNDCSRLTLSYSQDRIHDKNIPSSHTIRVDLYLKNL